MSEHIDTAALRAKLRVYDQTLPRCQKRIVRVSNHAPDYVAEEERAEWEMRLTYPCGELEGHEGQCREGRAILGWPGFATLTSLLDEVERLRAALANIEDIVHDGMAVARHEGFKWGARNERAAVVAWLRRNPGVSRAPECVTEMTPFEAADAIERGAHRNEEEP